MTSVASTNVGSLASRVREWVLALPPGTCFRFGDLPAPAPAAAVAMSRIVASRPDVQRLARGLYWRADPADPILPLRDDLTTALIHAGPGTGLADYTAVNYVGWSTQCTAKLRVCVVDRRLTPIDNSIRYVQRANPERKNLTWAEVTLVEAIRQFQCSEQTWEEAVRYMLRGGTINRLARGAVIRSEPFRVGGLSEKQQPRTFYARVNDLADQLPAEHSWEDHITQWHARHTHKAA